MEPPPAGWRKTRATGQCTGIAFINSTPLRGCHNRRIHSDKVFDGLATRGQCSIGWFYGFNCYLMTRDSGHVVDFMLTGGNTDDRKPLPMKGGIDQLFGKLCGDKGSISKELFEALIAYNFTKKKPSLKTTFVDTKQLMLF